VTYVLYPAYEILYNPITFPAQQLKKNIFLISTYFPPLNASATRRIESFAKYWPRKDRRVIVITSNKPNSALPKEFAENPLLKVRYVPYPYWIRAVYSTRNYLSGSDTGMNDIFSEKSSMFFFRQLGMKIESMIKKTSDTFHYLIHPSLFWVKPAYKVVCAELDSLSEDERRYSAIVASFPSIGPLIVGAKLAKKYDLPLCLDYRDLWIGTGKTVPSRVSPLRLLQPFNNYCRNRIENRASAAVVVSEEQKKVHEQQSQLKVAVIPNGFDFSKKVENQHKTTKCVFPIIIRYLGLIYPPNRTPQPLFEALSNIHNAPRKMHVEFYGTHPDQLLPLIQKSSCEAACSIYQSVPHRTSLELQQSADLLLLLDWSDENIKGVLTGKVFEYLASGRPILLIGAPEQSELAKLVRATDAGYVFGSDPKPIEEFMQKLIQSPQEYLKPRPISKIALQYDRKLLAKKYLRLIDGLMKHKLLSHTKIPSQNYEKYKRLCIERMTIHEFNTSPK